MADPKTLPENDYQSQYIDNEQFEDMLYARHVEIENIDDLKSQRGTPIPALFNQFYKFIQNPSAVSVETFKRMIDTDDTIGSGIDFLTTCLAARLGRYTHPNKDITEHVNKCMAAVDGGFINNVKEIMSASWAGFFVGEKVFADDQELGFIPKKIVPLPPSTILFETERTGEITEDGILQYQRNYNPYLLGRGVGYFGGVGTSGIGFGNATGQRPDVFAKLGDLPFPIRTANSFNYLSIRIPRAKCLHYSFDAQGKFRSPFGRSLLRRCYKYYVIKDAILQMMVIALDRKGTPLTVVYYDPNAPIFDQTQLPDPKNPATARGNPKAAIHPGKAAEKAMANLHNDSVVYIPGKKGEIYTVDTLSQQSNAQDFIAALEFCNKSILRALLLPALIFGDGQGGYALGEVHSKTFDKVLDGINGGLEDVLLNQWVKDILILNYPRSEWEKDGLGSFSKREMSQDEIQKVMDVFEKGIASGIIDQGDLNDLNKMRDSIGFDERNKPIERLDGMGGTGEGEEPSNEKEGEIAPEEKDSTGKKMKRLIFRLRQYVITARLQFNDGYNQGNITVDAKDEESAEIVATRRLREIWKEAISIDIVNVKKR